MAIRFKPPASSNPPERKPSVSPPSRAGRKRSENKTVTVTIRLSETDLSWWRDNHLNYTRAISLVLGFHRMEIEAYMGKSIDELTSMHDDIMSRVDPSDIVGAGLLMAQAGRVMEALRMKAEPVS